MTELATQDEATLTRDVIDWVEDATGGTLEHAQRCLGGVSREAWFVDVRTRKGELRPLFLRRDRSASPLRGSPYTSFREAAVYEALAHTEVPVPAIVAVSRNHGCVLMSRVVGESRFTAIANTIEREKAARHFMAILADLHHITGDTLDVPDLAGGGAADDVCAELDLWDEIERRSVHTKDPLRTFAQRWIRANVPEAPRPSVLVHGDAGPGNFAVREGKVVAVFDWELAHNSDPMEDLAWVCVRSVLQPFGDMRTRLRDYENAGGHRVSIDRIRYFFIVAAWRDVIALQAQLDADRPEIELAWCLAYKNTFSRLLLDEIGRWEGLTAGEPFQPPPTAAQGRVHHYLAHQLREIAANVSEPYLQHRARSAKRLVAHLDIVGCYGEELAAHEAEELAGLVGVDVSSLEQGREILAQRIATSESAADSAVYRHLRRANEREAFLLGPLIGRLGSAAFPNL